MSFPPELMQLLQQMQGQQQAPQQPPQGQDLFSQIFGQGDKNFQSMTPETRQMFGGEQEEDELEILLQQLLGGQGGGQAGFQPQNIGQFGGFR